MNIKINIPDTRVEFGKLKEGDVFRTNNALYMKIDWCSQHLEGRNAVSLYTGDLFYATDKTMVERVEHELIIKS